MSAVERASEVLLKHQRYDAGHCDCGWDYWGMSHSDHVAQALADAGLLVPGEAEVTVEYGVRYDDGDLENYGSHLPEVDDTHPLEYARDQAALLPKGGPDEAESGYVEAVIQRTVTKTRSEWTVVNDA